MTVDNSINLVAPNKTLMSGDQIESEEMILKFTSADKKESQMEFIIIDK